MMMRLEPLAREAALRYLYEKLNHNAVYWCEKEPCMFPEGAFFDAQYDHATHQYQLSRQGENVGAVSIETFSVNWQRWYPTKRELRRDYPSSLMPRIVRVIDLDELQAMVARGGK